MIRGSKTKQLAIALLALLAIAWGVLTICRHGRFAPEKNATAMHQRSGTVMAELTTKALGKSGRILLVAPDLTGLGPADKQQWMKLLLETFQRALPPGVTVAGRETPVVRPSRSTGQLAPGSAFTLAGYREMLQRHPDVQGVVSFAGEPLSPPGAALPNETSRLPLVCFCMVGDQVPALMKHGIVTAAVVPRNTPTPFQQVRGDWFDIMYQVVTPATIDAWVKP